MKIELLILFIVFQICHWAGDYTHLSTKDMLFAKAKGSPWQPIFSHALVHAYMVLLVCLLFLASTTVPILAFACFAFQLVTHFLIDLLKGKFNVWAPRLSDPTNKYHWYIFGADQLMHQVVIMVTVYWISLIVTF